MMLITMDGCERSDTLRRSSYPLHLDPAEVEEHRLHEVRGIHRRILLLEGGPVEWRQRLVLHAGQRGKESGSEREEGERRKKGKREKRRRKEIGRKRKRKKRTREKRGGRKKGVRKEKTERRKKERGKKKKGRKKTKGEEKEVQSGTGNGLSNEREHVLPGGHLPVHCPKGFRIRLGQILTAGNLTGDKVSA